MFVLCLFGQNCKLKNLKLYLFFCYIYVLQVALIIWFQMPILKIDN